MGPEYFWWGGMWVFPLFMILVMLVVYLIFGRGGFRGPCWHFHEGHRHRQDSETPLEILKRRYAQGEISKEEFDRMKNDILS